jgi:hypothetical protein
MNAASTPAANQPKGRGTLLLLALLFLAPLAFSFWLYYGTGWRPTGTTNHGTLIEPARPLATLAGDDSAGREAMQKLFSGHWSLVVVGRGQCDATCQSTLIYARQTVLGLGRLSTRVQKVFLVADDCCNRDYLRREHGDLIVVDLRAETRAANEVTALARWRDPLLAAFPTDEIAKQVFLVDPLGNLMMRYDTSLDPAGLRQDLKKLLGLSSIG